MPAILLRSHSNKCDLSLSLSREMRDSLGTRRLAGRPRTTPDDNGNILALRGFRWGTYVCPRLKYQLVLITHCQMYKNGAIDVAYVSY